MFFQIKSDTGSFDVQAYAQYIGDDLLIALYGGEKPHIGAVAAAHPRPGINDKNTISSTSSVICFSGHKEDRIVKLVSEKLSAALNTKVVVTAGMHWDNITKQVIKKVTENCEIIVKKIIVLYAI